MLEINLHYVVHYKIACIIARDRVVTTLDCGDLHIILEAGVLQFKKAGEYMESEYYINTLPHYVNMA